MASPAVSTAEPPSCWAARPARWPTGSSARRCSRLTVQGGNQPAGSGLSSYGLRAVGGAAVLIEGATVRAGAGGSGLNGVAGVPAAVPGLAGGDGDAGACGTGFSIGGPGATLAAGIGGFGGTSLGIAGSAGTAGERARAAV